MDEEREALIQAVREYITAKDWDEAKEVVEKRERLLLSVAADVMFAEMITLNEASPKAVEMLHTHREVLQWCRQDGIEAAFRRAKP